MRQIVADLGQRAAGQCRLPHSRHNCGQIQPQFGGTFILLEGKNADGDTVMTPITEDQVVALMDGFAAREKNVIKARDTEVADRQKDAAAKDGVTKENTTARILRFARGADVVALDAHRAKPAPRRTVSGMFFYMNGRDGAPA